MKNKTMITFVCLGAFLFGGLFYYQQFEQQSLNQKEVALMIVKKNQLAVTTKGEIYQEIQSLMNDAGYLVEEIQLADIQKLKETLTELKNESQQFIDQYDFAKSWIRPIEDAEALLTILEQKYEIQQEINQLFQPSEKLAINGAAFNAHLPLKQTITTVEVQQLQNKLNQTFSTQESNWKQMTMMALETIYEQATLMEAANRLLAENELNMEEKSLLDTLINNIKAPETKAFYLSKEHPLDPLIEETKFYDKDGNEMPFFTSESAI